LTDQVWIGLIIFKNFADQDWIGFNFIGSGLDSDWKISQSAHLWCRGSGFQDSSPAGFSTFWTNRIGSGLRFYSSFRIRFRIFKFQCFGIWRQHNH